MELFERNEQKYRLSGGQGSDLKKQIVEYLDEDPYSPYTIHSLYFDSAAHMLTKSNGDRNAYRLKVRLRWYSEFKAPFFLEIKRKFKKTTFKKRIMLSREQALELLENRFDPSDIPDEEIRSIFENLKLVPDRLVIYDRLAYSAKDQKDVRITFDQNLQVKDPKDAFNQDRQGVSLIEPDETLVECKALESLPLWLCGSLSRVQAVPASFSKSMKSYWKMKEANL